MFTIAKIKVTTRWLNYSHWTEQIEVEGATAISRNKRDFEDSYAPMV
jgi:hypothetical protein